MASAAAQKAVLAPVLESERELLGMFWEAEVGAAASLGGREPASYRRGPGAAQ